VVGPVDGAFVAHGHREHGVGVRAGQRGQPRQFSVVLQHIGRELSLAVHAAPRAARVAGFSGQRGAQQHLQGQAVFANHLQHPLGVHAAVVQAQGLEAGREQVQVLAHLRDAGEGLVDGALPLAIA